MSGIAVFTGLGSTLGPSFAYWEGRKRMSAHRTHASQKKLAGLDIFNE